MAFWVTLFRSILALILGLALLINQEFARPLLANFMGIYWISAGLISLRYGPSGERGGKSHFLVGLVGILAGVAVIGRRVASNWLDERLVITALGGVIILTGVLHVFGGFRMADGIRHRRWTSTTLGVFEILLGVTLLIEQTQINRPGLQLALMAWALLGGAILMLDAFRTRRRNQDKQIRR